MAFTTLQRFLSLCSQRSVLCGVKATPLVTAVQGRPHWYSHQTPSRPKGLLRAGTMAAGQKQRVWIDCDAGLDDAQGKELPSICMPSQWQLITWSQAACASN